MRLSITTSADSSLDFVRILGGRRPVGRVVRIVSGGSHRDGGPADWRNRAACRHQDPELFFPIGTTDRALTQLQKAKAVCHTCPVQGSRLEWVLRSEPLGQEAGVCAGFNEAERRSLKRRAARTPQPSLAGPKR